LTSKKQCDTLYKNKYVERDAEGSSVQIRRNCHYRKSRNTCLVRFIVETLLGYERCGYFGVPFPKYAQFSVRFHHRDEGGFFYLFGGENDA